MGWNFIDLVLSIQNNVCNKIKYIEITLNGCGCLIQIFRQWHNKGRKYVFKNCNHLSCVLYLLILFYSFNYNNGNSIKTSKLGLRNRKKQEWRIRHINMWLVDSKPSAYQQQTHNVFRLKGNMGGNCRVVIASGPKIKK